MANSSNSDSHFFLPRLSEGTAGAQPGQCGDWNIYPPQTYQIIASSLDLGNAVQSPQTASSIPSVWSRALLIETALHNSDYPLRSHFIEQWEGMLATIALAEIRSFDLRVQLVEFERIRNIDAFARSLYELMPAPSYALYTLRDQPLDRYNPWLDLYLFLWNGKPVGISSPSTLICPAEEADWIGLPWFHNQRLHSPISYLNGTEKALLCLWLENLSRGLSTYNGLENARVTITELLDQFRNRLIDETPNLALRLSKDPQFFGIPINRGALALLNYPISPPYRESSIRIIPSPEKISNNLPELLLLDEDLSSKWNLPPQDIMIHQDRTLANRAFVEELKAGTTLLDDNGHRVELIQADELLLDQFYFINRLDKALPSAMLPRGADRLVYQGESITPLIPINLKLLDYFTPEDLVSRITIEMIGASDVRVLIDIPLSGTTGTSPRNYRYQRTYQLGNQAISNLPVLEIWPNFKAKDWKEYYAFYYDQEQGDSTFQVKFLQSEQSHTFEIGKGIYKIARLEKFPACLSCCDRTNKQMGLIFLRSLPPKNVEAGTWKVGVDFGTSFTNVYVNKNGVVERLMLEPLNVQVTRTEQLIRDPVLVEFFITDNKLLLNLPLSTVLTTRLARPEQKSVRGHNQAIPFLDGCIYIPRDSTSMRSQEPYIKTGLKWSASADNRASAQLFLKHLVLIIAASAAKNNIGQIEWFLSYPSACSRRDRNTYSDVWEDISRELEASTGIKQICSSVDDSQHWKSEGVATAQYFADYEAQQLVNSTCINIGGSISDISIWENYQLIHQCSIRLASYDLFTQFVELNPKVLEKYFEMNRRDWSLRGDRFSAKLDVLLRREIETWLTRNRDIAAKNPEFQGLLQLIALGIAGLYYYVGIVLKTLREEGKYERNRAPSIYLGGNGARFLNFLAEGGRFDRNREINSLLSWMLVKGADFRNSSAEVSTSMSSHPNDEVACGLVLNNSMLRGWDTDRRTQDQLVAGEFYIVNGIALGPHERLSIDSRTIDTVEFAIPNSFVKLREFIEEFNAGVRELGMHEIQPIQLHNGIFDDVDDQLQDSLFRIRGKAGEMRIEPPFILALKALLRVLGHRWAEK